MMTNRSLVRSVRTSRKSSATFEVLEDRRLMSAALTSPQPVVAMDWKGQQIEARSGEWILGLSGKTDLMRDKIAPAQVRALQRRLGGEGGGVRVEQQLGRTGQFLLQVPDSVGYDRALASAKTLPGFEFSSWNGFLAPTQNDWLACLEALRDPALRRDVGERARESVIKKYSKEEQARRLIEVLLSLLY